MRWRVPAGNETSRPTEQTFQSTGPKNGSVEPEVEAAGIEPAQDFDRRWSENRCLWQHSESEEPQELLATDT